MVFRIPTSHSLLPPTAAQAAPTQHLPVVTWRGSLVVSGIRPSDRAGSQEIEVTAIEVDGDSRAPQWPDHFIARVLYERTGNLRDVVTYVQQYAVPMCTFAPDRFIRESGQSSANELKFRNLSRVLYENETVAIAPWGSPSILGAGMIIYPAQNSSSILVGALFIDRPFPDFLGLNSIVIPLAPAIPSIPQMYPQAQHPYSQGMNPPSYHSHSQSASPHLSDPNAPVGGDISQRQEYYQYMMGYGSGTSSPSSSAASGSHQWTGDLAYTGGGTFNNQQNPGRFQ